MSPGGSHIRIDIPAFSITIPIRSIQFHSQTGQDGANVPDRQRSSSVQVRWQLLTQVDHSTTVARMPSRLRHGIQSESISPPSHQTTRTRFIHGSV